MKTSDLEKTLEITQIKVLEKLNTLPKATIWLCSGWDLNLGPSDSFINHCNILP